MENSHKFQSRDGNSITDWSETILIEKITMKTIAARAPSRDETGEQKRRVQFRVRFDVDAAFAFLVLIKLREQIKV